MLWQPAPAAFGPLRHVGRINQRGALVQIVAERAIDRLKMQAATQAAHNPGRSRRQQVGGFNFAPLWVGTEFWWVYRIVQTSGTDLLRYVGAQVVCPNATKQLMIVLAGRCGSLQRMNDSGGRSKWRGGFQTIVGLQEA